VLRAVALAVVLGLLSVAAAAPLESWLADHYADQSKGMGPTLTKLRRYYNVKTTEDLMALGKHGVAKLHIPAKYRTMLKDALVHHLGESKGFDDGKMVTVPKPKPKAKKVDECGALSFLEVQAAAESEAESETGVVSMATPLGKFLLDKYPEDRKKLRPIIKKLEGQMIWNFKHLAALGSDGIDSITIPKKYRRVLKDALVTDIGVKNRVSDRMVPVPEGFNGLRAKRLRALRLRAAKAKAKRCIQQRGKRAARKAKKAKKAKKHKRGRRARKCSTKKGGGCIGRFLPVRYYPIIHDQNPHDVIHHADDLPPHVHWYTPEYHAGK